MTRSLNQEQRKNPQANSENPWIEAVKTIVTAGILAFGIRAFVGILAIRHSIKTEKGA